MLLLKAGATDAGVFLGALQRQPDVGVVYDVRV
jgi:hypothetical protein